MNYYKQLPTQGPPHGGFCAFGGDGIYYLDVPTYRGERLHSHRQLCWSSDTLTTMCGSKTKIVPSLDGAIFVLWIYFLCGVNFYFFEILFRKNKNK